MKKSKQQKEMEVIEAKSKKLHKNTLKDTQKVEAQIAELEKRKPKSRADEKQYTEKSRKKSI